MSISNKDSRLDASAFRVKRLRYATATSLLSKVATFSVQILVIPIAVRALGPEQFSIYAVLASTIAFFSMTNIGFGPALMVGIAAAKAAKQPQIEARLLSSAFFPVLGLTALIGCVLSVTVILTPIEVWLAIPQSVSPNSVRLGVLIVLLTALLQSLLSIFEAAQSGHQELHVRNLWMSFGNGVSLLVILLIAWQWPTLVGMIVAVRLPFIFAQGTNAMHFFKENAELIPRWSAFDLRESKSLLLSGGAVLFVTLGSYLNHQFPIFLSNQQLGANTTASIASVFSAFTLSFGMITLVGTPLRPAIADSVARQEHTWAIRAYRSFILSSMLYACLVGLVMAVAGAQILQIWVGSSISFDSNVVVGIGAYFVLAVWENVHYVMLIGLDRIRILGVLYLVRAILGAILMGFLVGQWGAVGIPVALCLSIVAVTGLPFYLLTRRELSRLKN